MELYAAIDLRGGRCVRLHQGRFDEETTYSDDPVKMAKSLASAGAHWLHVVDLDAARRTGSNADVVRAIVNAVTIPVQVGGGVRDASMLEAGAERVVIGSLLVEDPDAAHRLSGAHSGRVAAGLDHRNGMIMTRGWEQDGGVTLKDAVAALSDSFAAVVVTDIEKDGTLQGPETNLLGQVARGTGVPVIASGGVGSAADIEHLASMGVAGVIVGKAIYEQRISVEEAVAACRP